MGMVKQVLTEIQEDYSCGLGEAAVMFNGGVQNTELPCPFYDDCACQFENNWRACPRVWAEYEREIRGMEV